MFFVPVDISSPSVVQATNATVGAKWRLLVVLSSPEMLSVSSIKFTDKDTITDRYNFIDLTSSAARGAGQP